MSRSHAAPGVPLPQREPPAGAAVLGPPVQPALQAAVAIPHTAHPPRPAGELALPLTVPGRRRACPSLGPSLRTQEASAVLASLGARLQHPPRSAHRPSPAEALSLGVPSTPSLPPRGEVPAVHPAQAHTRLAREHLPGSLGFRPTEQEC